MPKEHELTEVQKAQIVALEPNFSHADIGMQLNIQRPTVTKFLQRFKIRKSIDNIPRAGRPRKTSETGDRWLIRNAESETRVPLKALKNILNIDISGRTIQRRLREVGIRKWKAVKRPALTKVHAHKRLKWARAHQHWTVDEWRKVFITDETIVERDSDPSVMWVFRRQTKKEKYASKNIRQKRQQDGISVMIWGCFIGDKLGPIAFIDGTVKKETYIGMLEEYFLPFLDAIYTDDPMPREFQQDNARPHIAKMTRDWFKPLAEKYGLCLMEWPPNSPDMNPIEHLWKHLKDELHRRHPDTFSLKGSPEFIKMTLRQRLHEVWWDIGADVLNRLVESMPERVKALLKAGGWYTEF